jgi:hypothetical protein
MVLEWILISGDKFFIPMRTVVVVPEGRRPHCPTSTYKINILLETFLKMFANRNLDKCLKSQSKKFHLQFPATVSENQGRKALPNLILWLQCLKM